MSKEYAIIIPVDFTQVSDSAVNYVLGMNQKINLTITLLHFVEKENEVVRAEKYLLDFKNKFDFNTINVSSKVIIGSIFQDMGKVSKTLEASLIVMGTHGEKGMQKVFGSNALKVVSNSKIPLIIVQETTQYSEINTIAMTIDLEKESIQIVKSAATLAKSFNAKILLVGGKHEDSAFKQKVNTNMLLCKDYLINNDINHEFHFLERKNFDQNFIEFCKEQQVDMLSATYYMQTFYAFSDKFVQHLITNELNIPLITIDSTATTSNSQYSFMSV
jgi:nucleotide-binding universal stress UspA family protein